MWILSGSTTRIAQRLGLHRDGSNHNISPFDAEIRRRTWWQIVFLDGHSSKLAGAGFPAWLAKFDTKIPLNISDSELSPSMKDVPTEKEGVTEMIFCCLRYETAQALRDANKHRQAGEGFLQIQIGSIDTITGKDNAINELEHRFQERYIRHCDPSIPLHLLAIYTAKSVICTMRINVHHPRQHPDKGVSMPQKEKDMVFSESLKVLEYDSLAHTTPAIRGYAWMIASHFQLDTFIYVLSELRHRTAGEIVDRAWQQIKLSYDNRPEMINDTKNSLYIAIGNLALKAWAKREEKAREYRAPPRFISLLRARRSAPDPPRPEISRDAFARPQDSNLNNNLEMPQNMNYASALAAGHQWDMGQWGAFDTNIAMPEITGVDWEYWQTLLDGDLPAYRRSNQLSAGDANPGQSWYM